MRVRQDPENDPLVYWTNGGPGGSGINAGLLTEMGQLHLNENSLGNDSVPTLLYNKYNWARVASTLYVSQPKGVGFSYCSGSGSCTNTDLSSAQDAVDFFHAFFHNYPEFKARDFYLTAESYGGICAPSRSHRTCGDLSSLRAGCAWRAECRGRIARPVCRVPRQTSPRS